MTKRGMTPSMCDLNKKSSLATQSREFLNNMTKG